MSNITTGTLNHTMVALSMMLIISTGCVNADDDITDLSHTYRWSNVPIGGGGYFINVLPHPTRPNELYVNSDMTGPFVRYSPDEAFTNLSYYNHAFEHPTISINAASEIAISPHRPDTIFVSIRGNGLMRSVDAGKTFQAVHPVSSFSKQNGPTIAIDPANPDIIFRGTDDDGLFRSTNGGAPGSWQRVIVSKNAKPKATHLVVYPPNGNIINGVSQTIYVAVVGVGLHVSHDGGKTFAKVADRITESTDVPDTVTLLADAIIRGKPKHFLRNWKLLDKWMRGAVRIDESEKGLFLIADQKGKFAQRFVALPSNMIEVTLSLDARTQELVAGNKPHETSGAQLVFKLPGGKTRKAHWKKALFLKPGLQTWTPHTTTANVPEGATHVGVQIGSQATSGAGHFTNIKITGKTDGTAPVVRMNPAWIKQMDCGPDGTIYMCGRKLLAYHPQHGWRNLAPSDKPGSNNVGVLGVHPKKAGHLLILGGMQKGRVWPLYRSKDDGKMWEGPFWARDNNRKQMSYSGVPSWAFFWPAAGPAVLNFDPHRESRVYHSDAYMVWQCDDIWADKIHWTAQWRGLEDTVPVSLAVSPRPDGQGTELMAAGADIRGMRWTNPHELPANRIGDMDRKQVQGSDMCSFATSENHPRRWYGVLNRGWKGPTEVIRSDDGGIRWKRMTKPIPDKPSHGGPKIAVSATNPDVVVYIPGLKLAPQYSHDGGKTWQKATGVKSMNKARRNFSWDEMLAADTVNGDTFYCFNPIDNRFYVSRDAGRTWNATAAKLPKRTGHEGGNTSPIQVTTKPGAAGTVVVSLSDNGVFRSTDYGQTFEQLTIFKGGQACGVSYGAPAPGSDTPTLYVLNFLDRDGHKSVYRSFDDGVTWQKVGNTLVETSHSLHFVASRQVFGRVYFATNGRGAFVGEPE